jgi:hypothetical protein
MTRKNLIRFKKYFLYNKRMTYSESQRIATEKYRQKTRERINEMERNRYAKMKEEDPDKYKCRLERCAALASIHSKEKTAQNKHIRGLMHISI